MIGNLSYVPFGSTYARYADIARSKRPPHFMLQEFIIAIECEVQVGLRFEVFYNSIATRL